MLFHQIEDIEKGSRSGQGNELKTRLFSLFVAVTTSAMAIVFGAVLVPRTLTIIEKIASSNEKLPAAGEPPISASVLYAGVLALIGSAFCLLFVAVQNLLFVIRGVPRKGQK